MKSTIIVICLLISYQLIACNSIGDQGQGSLEPQGSQGGNQPPQGSEQPRMKRQEDSSTTTTKSPTTTS